MSIRKSPFRGGKRTPLEKVNEKCSGVKDVVTLEKIAPENAIRLLENGHYYCFDIQTLFEWFQTGKRTNPLTNLLFSESNIIKINKKFIKSNMVFMFEDSTDDELIFKRYAKLNDIRVFKPNAKNALNYNFNTEDDNGETYFMVLYSNFDILFFTRDMATYTNLIKYVKNFKNIEPNKTNTSGVSWLNYPNLE